MKENPVSLTEKTKSSTDSLISLDKKYTTRHGEEVRLYTTEAKRDELPVIGEVRQGENWYCYRWTKEGHYSVTHNPTDIDLIEVKTKKKGWIVSYTYHNYMGTSSRSVGTLFQTKELALQNFSHYQSTHGKGTITDPCFHEIEWEE
jgi:hypothetical protein